MNSIFPANLHGAYRLPALSAVFLIAFQSLIVNFSVADHHASGETQTFSIPVSQIIQDSFSAPFHTEEKSVVWIEDDNKNPLNAFMSRSPAGAKKNSTKIFLSTGPGKSAESVVVRTRTFSPSPKLSQGNEFQDAKGFMFLPVTPQESEKQALKWSFTPTRPGTYDVWILGTPGKDSQPVSLEIEGNPAMNVATPESNHASFSHFAGRAVINKGGQRTIALKNSSNAPTTIHGIWLIPASEGVMPKPKRRTGEIVLQARSATIHGVKLQYEPQPHKDTVGFWIHVTDSFFWDFQVTTPGNYVVEIHQGCGRGHGGSKAVVTSNNQSFPFEVIDTGHFQNFLPRNLGILTMDKPGIHRLHVKALENANVAIMDVRRLKLIPIEKY